MQHKGYSWWNTSSIEDHHSPGLRSGSGSWQESVSFHHRFTAALAVNFAISALKSSPTYS